MHTISSPRRSVIVNPLGAELHSIVSSSTSEEFMWMGDPAVWSGRAPVLFPVVGRLKQNEFQCAGKPFNMAQHGFVRKRQFECETLTENRVTLAFRSDAESLAMYPWKFSLLVDFEVNDDALTITYTIENHSEQVMLFNIGSHPAFQLPLQQAKHEDYRIHFDQAEALATYSIVDGLLQKDPTPWPLQDQRITLSKDIFNDDALVFMNINSSEITLEHKDTGPRVRVSTDSAPHLGLWSKPAAPYVCIEPWWGHADFVDASGELADKASIQSLAAGDSFATHIRVTTFDR